MDVQQTLTELRATRDLLNHAIASLEALLANRTPRRRGRPRRFAVREQMKVVAAQAAGHAVRSTSR